MSGSINPDMGGSIRAVTDSRSDRVWIMDRGIPTEATLATMREGDAPVHYLVGTRRVG